MTAVDSSRAFGDHMRLWRLTIGMSLRELARRTHYNPGYLSKIENGKRPVTVPLARHIDGALSANGRLSALVPRVTRNTGDTPPPSEIGLTVGTSELLAGIMLPHRDGAEPCVAVHIADQYAEQLALLRRTGQNVGPGTMLHALRGQLLAIGSLIAATDIQEQPSLIWIAARYADYAGWMAQEAGHDATALRLIERAVQLAKEVGDPEMAAHATVREALVTLYRNDADLTITLARRAQRLAADLPRVRGAAALREGQGHALAGNELRFRDAMERAQLAYAEAGDDASVVPLGSSILRDPVTAATGWSLSDLGRHGEGAVLLETELRSIPRSAARAYLRYAVRCALQHAMSGELGRACDLAEGMVADIRAIDSATIRRDVVDLVKTLSRRRGEPRIQPLIRELKLVLHAQAL